MINKYNRHALTLKNMISSLNNGSGNLTWLNTNSTPNSNNSIYNYLIIFNLRSGNPDLTCRLIACTPNHITRAFCFRTVSELCNTIKNKITTSIRLFLHNIIFSKDGFEFGSKRDCETYTGDPKIEYVKSYILPPPTYVPKWNKIQHSE